MEQRETARERDFEIVGKVADGELKLAAISSDKGERRESFLPHRVAELLLSLLSLLLFRSSSFLLGTTRILPIRGEEEQENRSLQRGWVEIVPLYRLEIDRFAHRSLAQNIKKKEEREREREREQKQKKRKEQRKGEAEQKGKRKKKRGARGDSRIEFLVSSPTHPPAAP